MPRQQQAVVYSQSSRTGVQLTSIMQPTIDVPHDPQSVVYKILYQLFLVSSFLFGWFRVFFGRILNIPPPYGELGPNRKRHFVLVKVHCGGLNPVDAKFLYGDKLPEFCQPLVQSFLEGKVCGIDFSGTVIDAPEGCGFSVGDEVFGTSPPLTGSFAEVIRVPTDFIEWKPKGISFAEACALPLVSLTSHQAFCDQKVREGQHVLVLGASGGTGHVAVQVAKYKKATVTAVCGKRNKQFVRDCGADHVITYDENADVVEQLQAIVSKHGPFDLVFDSVSSHDQRDMAFCYEQKVRFAQPSLLSTDKSMYIQIGGTFPDWIRAHLRRFVGINTFPTGKILHWVRFPDCQSALHDIGKMCTEKKLKIKIGKRVPFTQKGVEEAFELQMSRHAVGKIIIEIIPE